MTSYYKPNPSDPMAPLCNVVLYIQETDEWTRVSTDGRYEQFSGEIPGNLMKWLDEISAEQADEITARVRIRQSQMAPGQESGVSSRRRLIRYFGIVAMVIGLAAAVLGIRYGVFAVLGGVLLIGAGLNMFLITPNRRRSSDRSGFPLNK